MFAYFVYAALALLCQANDCYAAAAVVVGLSVVHLTLDVLGRTLLRPLGERVGNFWAKVDEHWPLDW